MLATKTIKLWCRIHTWSSLISTVFLLLLCVTGLPLIFYHEIDNLLGYHVEAPALPESTPKASLDRIVQAGLDRYPNEFVQYVVWEADEPNLVGLSIAPSRNAPGDNNRWLVVDQRTAKVLDEPNFRDSIMFFFWKLHTEMFMGLKGKLFLGGMGLVFVVAVVSGVVIYGPFMRKLSFGAVRSDKGLRVGFLDLHNLLGIVTVAWALTVGGTGVFLTWADLVIQGWQNDQLAEMVAPYKNKPPPLELGSLQRAVETARAAAPGKTPDFVAFPGSAFSSNHHYAVFMRGDSPLKSRLFKPVLVDAVTSDLTDTREVPWYVATLLLSQPLHFGDYGGMPLKILWGLLDLITIFVLGSGLYLWFARRRFSLERRIPNMRRDQVEPTNGNTERDNAPAAAPDYPQTQKA